MLFVHDRNQASIWLIDFAKTVSLPSGINITHMNEWIVGNHEDGYLIGINNLIQIFEEIMVMNETKSEQIASQTNENEAECGDDYEIQEISTSNTINCTDQNTSDTLEIQAHDNNMDLPQEIDAMKIDQTMQHASHEGTEDKPRPT